MKKTLKSIICSILAIMLALGSITAFAADADGIITWVHELSDETFYCQYAGNLKLGENKLDNLVAEGEDITLECPDKEEVTFDICYDFNADKAGYYFITVDGSYDVEFGIVAEKSEGNTAYNTKETERVYSKDDNFEGTLVYLEKGRQLFAENPFVQLYTYGEYEDITVNIEYYGEKITDIEIADEYLKNLVIGYDLEQGETRQVIRFDADIIFSSGKKIGTDKNFECFSDKKINEGNNTLTLKYLGFEKKITVEAYGIEKYIKSISQANPEKRLEIKKDYLGQISHADFYDNADTVTVTFTDNSTKNYKFTSSAAIEIGEREYFIFCNYIDSDSDTYYYDGDISYIIEIAGKTYVKLPCKITENSFTENLAVLKSALSESISSALYYTEDYMQVAFFGKDLSIADRAGCFARGIDFFCSIGSRIVKNVNAFINYYTAN